MLTLLTVLTTAYVVADVALTHHRAAKLRKNPAQPAIIVHKKMNNQRQHICLQNISLCCKYGGSCRVLVRRFLHDIDAREDYSKILGTSLALPQPKRVML